jgi:Cys-rich protein (TIGR01571 family)
LVCVLLTLFLTLGFTCTAVSQQYQTEKAHPLEDASEAWEEDEDASSTLALVGFVGSLASCLACIITMKVRKQIRDAYKIREENCAGCEDCCCASWCGVCTQCQIMRQVGLTYGNYSLFSAGGNETPAFLV